MQPKSTLRRVSSSCVKFIVCALIFLSASISSKAQVLFSEDFVTVIPGGGWAQQNLSSPIGATNWFQGNTAVFTAQSGPPNSYAGANFNNVNNFGTISNWLFTPNVTLKNGDIFTFYARAIDGGFPDRLQVRLSTSGASVNVGATATSTGDFGTLLLDINPTYQNGVFINVWTQYTITISGLGGPTSGRLAFRYFVENAGFSGANSDFIGIDNAVYTTFAAPCAGAPTPGQTVATPASVCPGINFTLTLPSLPPLSGYSYQWQSSLTGVPASFANIAGATNSTLTTNQAVATYYRCNVSCGANTGASTPVQVTMNPPTSCYCVAGSPDVTFEKISRVQFNTIDNPSTGQNSYQNFTAISTNVIQLQTIPITVTISGAFSSDVVRVWIDFNQNGSFSDPGELVTTTPAGLGPLTGNITIPVTSSLGPTRMRVRLYDSGFDPNPGPCGNTSFGEVEDYTVNIQPCVQGVFTTQPANSTIQCSNTTSFTVAATGSALSFYWEYRINASSPWLNVPNAAPYSGVNTTTLTLTNVSQAFNGYQYRAVMQGPCTAVDFSNAATLTVNPLVATVNPASATICTGTIQQLTITNVTSSPTTQTFSSGAINIPIPDANQAGISHSIPVNLPVGSIITNVVVRYSIPAHTWAGDLVVALKAPNNRVVNLDYFITTTGFGPTLSGAFVNTTFSQAASNALSSGTPPYTNTFKVDGQVAATVNGPSGPTGMAATHPQLQDLWNSVQPGNGNWTLGVYDGFGGDVGNLTAWSMDITYVAPVFASGVWTANPAAPNTMFTDPAALNAYVAGTPLTTIYVKPTVNTVYSVVVTTGTPCVSAPTLVPVNVTNPVSAVVNPTNKVACVGTTTTFTASASGGPLTYQWQVSVNGGVSFSDISGATNASLVLSNVTQLMNNNQYRVRITATPCNTITSGIATLTINPLPTVSLSASDLNLVPGGTSTVTVASSPAGASYSWTLDGSTIAGATGSSVIADIDHLGEYRAKVTDVNGCVNTTAPLLIGAEASDRLWIYPNPSSGQFQVRLYYGGDLSEKRVVSIYNAQGQLITKKEFALDIVPTPYMKMDFDLTKQGPGVYVVKVAHKYSGKITSGLVVIQQ